MGGENTWVVPHVMETVEWGENGERIKRSPGEFRTRNEELYEQRGLTWAHIKETGRRFGLFPPNGIYNNSSCVFIPEGDVSLEATLAIVNSTLYYNLMLSLTPERHWQPGEVGSLPWVGGLTEIDELEKLTETQREVVLRQRSHNPTSPHYQGPLFSAVAGISFIIILILRSTDRFPILVQKALEAGSLNSHARMRWKV